MSNKRETKTETKTDTKSQTHRVWREREVYYICIYLGLSNNTVSRERRREEGRDERTDGEI